MEANVFQAALPMTPEMIIEAMNLDGENLKRRLAFVGFKEEDARRVAALRPLFEFLGAKVILTGFSPELFRALLALGVDLGSIRTSDDLQSGIRMAEEELAPLR